MPTEEKIPLGNIAEITSSTGPNTINRENVVRKIVISTNVAGRDLRGVVNDIQKKIDAEIQLPEGYHIEYGGQFESEQAASRILLITSIFSILVIFSATIQPVQKRNPVGCYLTEPAFGTYRWCIHYLFSQAVSSVFPLLSDLFPFLASPHETECCLYRATTICITKDYQP